MEVFDILGEGRLGVPCILLKGNGEVVANLDFEGTEDFPWLVFKFQPLPAWSDLGPEGLVFDGDYGLKPGDGSKARVAAILRLDLWLVTADRRVIVGNFLFILRGGRAYIRSYDHGPRTHSIFVT